MMIIKLSMNLVYLCGWFGNCLFSRYREVEPKVIQRDDKRDIDLNVAFRNGLHHLL